MIFKRIMIICFLLITANMMAFTLGTITVWVSACRHYFTSDHPPLGPINIQFISWSSSIPYLSALLGLFIWGNVSERWGRKPAGLLLGLPMTTMYAILYFSHSQTVVLIARFIGGFSNVGCVMCVTLYVKEIASADLRARLSNVMTISIVTGSLFIITLSSLVSYENLNLVMLVWCLVYLVMFTSLPETPVYHIMNDDYKNARESLEWLRPGISETDLKEEIEALKETFIKKSSIPFFDIFRNKYYFKTMLIGVFLQTAVCNMFGFSIFLVFSSEIFEKLLHETDVSNYNIIFTVLQIAGNLTTFWLGDKFGRRTYLVAAPIILSVILFTLAVYQYFTLHVKFLALGLMFVYIFIFCSICFPIMYIYFHEIISSESSNHIFTLMMLGKNVGWFAFTKSYNYVEEQISLEGIFLIFWVGALIMTAVTLTFPESRRKSLQQLKAELAA